MELRAMHRELADRPVEIDVGNPSAALILAQKVVEPRHIALRFDDPSFHYNICAERPFAVTCSCSPASCERNLPHEDIARGNPPVSRKQ